MGLSTKIQFSEGVSSNATWNYVQPWQTDAEVWKYVGMLTYHLYGEHWSSPSPDVRATLYAFAQAHNIPTGQTEFMDADTDDIYEDLTIGGVSVWEQFQACAMGKGDVAGSGSYMTARYDGMLVHSRPGLLGLPPVHALCPPRCGSRGRNQHRHAI